MRVSETEAYHFEVAKAADGSVYFRDIAFASFRLSHSEHALLPHLMWAAVELETHLLRNQKAFGLFMTQRL